jgi:hypothetical protein
MDRMESTTERGASDLQIGIAALAAADRLGTWYCIQPFDEVVNQGNLDHVREGGGLLRQCSEMTPADKLLLEVSIVRRREWPSVITGAEVDASREEPKVVALLP